MRENDLAANLTFSSCSNGFLNHCLLSLWFLLMLSNTIDLPSTCVCVHAQSCLTLCNLMNCSLPSSSVRGIFQARILEKVAISPPGHLTHPGSNPCLQHFLHWQVDSLLLSHLGSPRCEAPRFPGPLLIRTRCPDTSPNSTL